MTARLIILAVVLAASTWCIETSAADPGRILWVIDGDTYQIAHAGAPRGEPVRARHFDTPEKGEKAHCEAERVKAAEATAAAKRLLPKGSQVLLSDLGRDRYGRLLASISLPDGTDIATWFIRNGLARPYEGGAEGQLVLAMVKPFPSHDKRNAPRRGVPLPNPPRHMRGGGMNCVALDAPLTRPNQGASWGEKRMKKGLSAPRGSMGKRRAKARRQGPGCPKNPQADRFAPSGFWELPRPAPDP